LYTDKKDGKQTNKQTNKQRETNKQTNKLRRETAASYPVIFTVNGSHLPQSFIFIGIEVVSFHT